MCVFVEFREGIKPLKREGLRYAFLMMLQSNAVMLPSSKDMHSLDLCTLGIFSIQCSYVFFSDICLADITILIFHSYWKLAMTRAQKFDRYILHFVIWCF